MNERNITNKKFIDFYNNKLKLTNEIKEAFIISIKILISILDKNNIDYWLFGGSLLGAIRHDGLIPWDDDFDIIILEKDENKIINLFDEFKKNNLGINYNSYNNYSGWFQFYNNVYKNNDDIYIPLDIFVFKLDKSKNYFTYKCEFYKFNPERYFLYSELYPIQKHKFEDMILNIPNNYDNYFKLCNFGDYMNEIKIFNHNQEVMEELKKFPKYVYEDNYEFLINKKK